MFNIKLIAKHFALRATIFSSLDQEIDVANLSSPFMTNQSAQFLPATRKLAGFNCTIAFDHVPSTIALLVYTYSRLFKTRNKP